MRSFEQVRQKFIEALPMDVQSKINLPTSQSLRDRFLLLVESRLEQLQNEKEEETENEDEKDDSAALRDLLDVLIFEMEEAKHKKDTERNQKKQKEEDLNKAGNNIRNCSLNRLEKDVREAQILEFAESEYTQNNVDDDHGMGETYITPKKKARIEVRDDINEIFMSSVVKKDKQDQLNMELKKKRA